MTATLPRLESLQARLDELVAEHAVPGAVLGVRNCDDLVICVAGTTRLSNSGFNVLGRLVECLTDQTWDDALEARLIEPLGLRHTFTRLARAAVHPLAVGHEPKDPSSRADAGLAISFHTSGEIAEHVAPFTVPLLHASGSTYLFTMPRMDEPLTATFVSADPPTDGSEPPTHLAVGARLATRV